MATDYDAPRKTDDDLNEDSIEELKARRVDKVSGTVDEDESDAAFLVHIRFVPVLSGHGRSPVTEVGVD